MRRNPPIASSTWKSKSLSPAEAWMPHTRLATCVLVAAANLAQHKLRLAAAALGIGVALVLLVIQIAFLDAARAKVSLLFDFFDFDIAVVPATYQFLYSPGAFDRIRLTQARGAA